MHGIQALLVTAYVIGSTFAEGLKELLLIVFSGQGLFEAFFIGICSTTAIAGRRMVIANREECHIMQWIQICVQFKVVV